MFAARPHFVSARARLPLVHHTPRVNVPVDSLKNRITTRPFFKSQCEIWMLAFTSAVKDWSSVFLSCQPTRHRACLGICLGTCALHSITYTVCISLCSLCGCVDSNRAFKRVHVFTAYLSSSLIKLKLFSSPLIVAVATSQQADLSQTHTHTRMQVCARKKSRAFNRK